MTGDLSGDSAIDPGIGILDRPRGRREPGRGPARRGRSMLQRIGRHRRVVAGGGAVTLLLIGFGAIRATSSNAADQFRLASVSRGTVTQSITSTGALAPISQAAVSFPTSGTVARLYAKAGQRVRAGERLAQLDTLQLETAVTRAEKNLADAEVGLERTEDGSATSSSNTSSAQTQSRANDGGASPTSTGGKSDPAELKRAIKNTQKAIDSALAASKIDLTAATSLCAGSARAAATDSRAGNQPSPTPGSGGGSEPVDCESARQRVLQDQLKIASLQIQQSEQITKLDQAVQSSGGQTTPANQSETSTATGEQIAAGQARVDAARAALTEARQNLSAATIVSPISGKVLDVPYAKGDQVDTGDRILIAGGRQFQATVQIAVDKIAAVSPGQVARVQPSGTNGAMEARVATIGVAPVSGDGSVTYPVTVTLPEKSSALRSGATAAVEIVTAEATDALTVPTSAIRALGTIRTVTAFSAGTSRVATVSVGAVGATRTQIVDGLQEGDQVVLADLSEPTPTSTTANVRLLGRYPGRG